MITDEDNVVRLPREWLGPPGQLVPVAEDDSVPVLETPGSTHDFWGEALADDLGVRVESGDAGARARVRRAFRWPSFARGGREAGRTRRVPPRAVLGAAGVLMIVALAIGNSGAPAAPPRGSASASIHRSGSSSGTVAFVPHGTLASAPARSGTPRRHPVARHRPATPRHVAHRAVPRHVAHRAVPIHAATVEPVRYSTVSPTTSTYSSSSAPPPSASASPSAAATGASAGSHQPATGATGALGPGSSPDG